MSSSFLDLANTLLHKWREPKANPQQCFVGFDGFTDEIAVPVAKIGNVNSHFPTMESFTSWLSSMSGKSCNVELEISIKKIGGNAPILANALVEGGHRLSLAGCLGREAIEPIFLPLTNRCEEVFTLEVSGHSDALEFSDGKIILGKLSHITQLKADTVVKKLGKEKLLQLLDRSALFISANWTMMPMMNGLWEYIIKEILPNLSVKKRYLFVDLADPTKRPDADLKQAIQLLQQLNQVFDVVQGLNLAEAERLAKILKIETDKMDTLALELQKALGFKQIVIHHAKEACAATSQGIFPTKTFYTPQPSLLTGAGDNFNAGYCNALLFDFAPQEALILAIATAGYYVRQGKSPTMEELAIFLQSMG